MSIFKSKYFWLTLGFVLLVAAILVLGAWLEVSLVVRFAAVMAVMMVGMILLMIGFIRASRSASQIEQSLRVQAKQQLVNTRPDKRAEIEELQKQLEVAIERLKRSKLGRGKGGRAALYAMPWYLFIGPPAAGKTTAILNSGLNFPLGTDRIRGVGGTRNCDWFFTDQAILLDTAGRYVTEHEDEEEWYAFLDTLKKHRKDRPINGAIVGISLDELAQATPDEIEWHASTIRERVDELVARLGVRFPVFLVFTKCDLMQGFVEFFGDLSRKEREQIWGSTFVREEIEKKEAGALFEEEFHKLYRSLLALRSARLNRSMKREDRRKVYVFPLEFAAMKENLSLFVSRLFQPNPYQESPVFRGFYFSSGTQEGAPIDRVIQSIARQFDLPPDSTDNGSGPQVVKSYFIKELFTDVIVPDQYMVRQTSRQAVRGRLAKAGMGVAGIFLLALWLLGLSQALLRSQHSLGEVEQAAMAAAGVNWLDPQRHESELANMDALRERLERLDRDARRFRPLRLGLDRSGTVLPATRRLYLERVHAYAATNLFGDMQDHLRNAVRIRDLDAARRDSVRDGLRAYLLMTTETGRLEEEANAVFLRRYLTERSMAGQREVAFSEMDARREALDRQFGVYATALARGDISSFGGDVSLVSRARSLIYEPPSVDRLYRRIKEDGEVEFEPLTLADILRGRYLDMFAGQPQVPGIFTKRGWATYVEPAIAGMAEGGGRPDWIMGHSEDEEPAELADRDQLTSQLEQLYFSEYAMAWERFLRDVRLARFGDLRSAVQFLTELSSPYESPILYILAQATAQTTFADDSVVEGLLGRAEEAGSRRADAESRRTLGQEGGISRERREAPQHPVDRRFARLHEIGADRAQSGDASPTLERALQSIGTIANSIQELQGDPALAADYADRVFGQNGWDMANHLQTVNSNLGMLDPELRTALFVDPVLNAWEVVLRATQQHLNEQWRTEVFEPYRALSNRYPLDQSSDADAPLDDFENFFHPENGRIDAFFRSTLVHFLTPDRRRGRSWNGRGVEISGDVFAAAEAAQRIGQGMFSADVLQAEFELRPEVPDYEPNAPRAGQMEIEIHGRSDTYDLGGYRPWTQFAWPGRSGAAIRVSTQQGPESKSFHGDWAWFRMLQEARIRRMSQTEYEIHWPFDNGVILRYHLRTRSSTNPYGNPRAFFNLRVPENLN